MKVRVIMHRYDNENIIEEEVIDIENDESIEFKINQTVNLRNYPSFYFGTGATWVFKKYEVMKELEEELK